jgi:hypothetical protein
MKNISDIAASCFLIAALVWAVGALIGAWLFAIGLLVVWAVIRALPVWFPAVKSGADILFGDRYTTAETLAELFDDVEADVRDELIPQVLEAARRIHNWASRASAALISVIGLLAMWAAQDNWQPFVFLFFAAAVTIAATWPAIKRRWDERHA